MKKKAGIALCVLGLVLAIFGIVWITVLWPSLARIPANLDQETLQQGTVTLYDAERDAYVTLDVINSRHYVAREANKDILYLDETITFTNTAVDQEIPSLRANYSLAVDRVTRVNVDDLGDGVDGGHYSFPFNVDKDKVYPFWNEGNPANLDCAFVDQTDFEGLHVYIFEMSTPDEGLVIPASSDTPQMRIDQTIRQYVEPVSGVTVYFESTTKRSGDIPVYPITDPVTYRTVTFYEDDLKFTDETIADLVSQAKSAKSQIGFAKNVLPWLCIGGGIALIAVGVFLARSKVRALGRPESKGSGSP